MPRRTVFLPTGIPAGVPSGIAAGIPTGILAVSGVDYDVSSVPKAVEVAPAATRDAAAGWGSPHGPWTRGSRGQQS
ncbi:hypothetical protein ABIE67_007596 [Streptomyces sp. V4I8]